MHDHAFVSCASSLLCPKTRNDASLDSIIHVIEPVSPVHVAPLASVIGLWSRG